LIPLRSVEEACSSTIAVGAAAGAQAPASKTRISVAMKNFVLRTIGYSFGGSDMSII